MNDDASTERLAHLFAEILNTRALDRFDALLSRDYVNHNPFAEPGPDGVKKVFAGLLAGIPDMLVVVEDAFASRDGTKVVGRYSYEGTHSGSFLNYPASGNRISMRSIDIWRVEDGRFVEHWDELNTLDVFTQIGTVDMKATNRMNEKENRNDSNQSRRRHCHSDQHFFRRA